MRYEIFSKVMDSSGDFVWRRLSGKASLYEAIAYCHTKWDGQLLERLLAGEVALFPQNNPDQTIFVIRVSRP